MGATGAETPAGYPLGGYAFRVVVGSDTMRFAKVSGLERQHQTLTYRDGMSFRDGEQITKYHVDKFISLTLEQGTVAGDHHLATWLETRAPVGMEVQLCDPEGTPVLAWRIRRALPVKLTASARDASRSAVAIDTLEVKAAGVTIVTL